MDTTAQATQQKNPRHPFGLMGLLAVFCLMPVLSTAADDPRWRLCPPQTSTATPVSIDLAPRTDGSQQISADRISGNPDGVMELTGDVRLYDGSQLVRAETLRLDNQTDILNAQGKVVIERDGDAFITNDATYNLKDKSGTLGATDYRLTEHHARGSAERVELIDDQRSRYRNVTYTTCNPGDDGWQLRAGDLVLDRDQGFGTARNTWVTFQSIPIFYWPYVTFPIDNRRKSGFLMPEIGYSESLGGDLRTPYYLNLAPNYDATLTPRFMGRRGFQLGTELRYLTPASRGTLDVAHMWKDEVTKEERSLLRYNHTNRLGRYWRAEALLEGVSDPNYFNDLNDTIGLTSLTHLERRIDLGFNSRHWSGLLRAQGYQTIDETIALSGRPYQRLPQLKLNWRDTTTWAEGQLDTEWVRFEHNHRLTGTRLDLQPRMETPLENSWGFVRPAVSYRLTQYQLDDVAPGDNETPERDSYTFSLDSGLFFERFSQGGGRTKVHTLEPRLFYLYRPLRDQDELPIFDTSHIDLSYAQLFRESRFSGPDRVGDADQATLALTSRQIDRDSGREEWRLGIGRIFYHADREVQLPGIPVETANRSPLIMAGSMRLPSHWSGNAEWHWDDETDTTAESNWRLQYRPDDDYIINLAYRYQRDTLHQRDLSGRWRLSNRWHLVARELHDLENETTLDAFWGVEYESCCWAVSLLAQEQRDDITGEADRGIYLQLELKGLTQVGGEAKRLLEDGILGYPRKGATQ